MIITFLIAIFFEIACGVADAYFTAKGIKAGLFVEGNETITDLYHTNKPSFWQLTGFNLCMTAILNVFGDFGIPYHNEPLIFLSIVCLFTNGVKHLTKVRKARRMGA